MSRIKILQIGIALSVVFGASASAAEPATAKLPETEAKAFEMTCRALAESFIKNDGDGFLALCIPKDRLAEVLSPKIMERGAEEVHKQIVEGNTRRFNEYRKRFQDLAGFEFASAEVGYRLARADEYVKPELVLKNSYVTITMANRILIKLKMEELVFVGGKYYLAKLD